VHPYRLAILSGTAFAVGSMLLPFVSLPVTGPVDGLSADAWPALLPLVPLVILILDGRWDGGLDAGAAITASLLVSASLLFGFVKLGDAVVAARSATEASLGPGGWVLVASLLIAAAGVATGVFLRR
jgi:hypothetical protein